MASYDFQYTCLELRADSLPDFLRSISALRPCGGRGSAPSLFAQLKPLKMAEKGIPLAGAGTSTTFRGANAAAEAYGGVAADYAKMSSRAYTARDGTQFETYWIQNTKTQQRYQFKTKLFR